ncbi:Coiled-coil domain-containing protein, partial [Fragariocoptes setiger]
MAERRATNKYYPTDWDPSKGSINKYRNSHPLRDRAKKLDQGILVVRFEMPFNIWCEGCNNHIGMGVRYNAEKTKAGKYYSTTIFRFRMKCHLCDNHFEIETDPTKLDYTIVSGAKRQTRRISPEDEEEEHLSYDKADSKRRAIDAMYKLEREIEDRLKVEAGASQLKELEKVQKRWDEDFGCNQLLRNNFRKEKRRLESLRQKDQELLDKFCLDLELAKETPSDARQARSIIRSRTSKGLSPNTRSAIDRKISLRSFPSSIVGKPLRKSTKDLTLPSEAPSFIAKSAKHLKIVKIKKEKD